MQGVLVRTNQAIRSGAAFLWIRVYDETNTPLVMNGFSCVLLTEEQNIPYLELQFILQLEKRFGGDIEGNRRIEIN